MGKTSIEWCDAVWNPVRGCSLVSPGCTNCYAMKQAHRFAGPGQPYAGLTKMTSHGPVWRGTLRTHPEMLDEPLRWKKPRRVFVNSMSDLFHETVPDLFIAQVFEVMAEASRHTFQILTKRPERMLAWFNAHPAAHWPTWLHPWPLPNVWLGVSVEDQQRAEERIPLLLQTPATVRFLSCEPLLENVDITPYLWGKHAAIDTVCQGCPRDADCECGYYTRKELSLPAIEWVIVGGESGPGARPFDIQWAREIVEQCKGAGVPVFVKQIGSQPRGWCSSNAPEHIGTADAADLRAEGEDGCCVNYEASEQAKPCEAYGRGCVMLQDRAGGDPSEWPEDLRVREFPK